MDTGHLLTVATSYTCMHERMNNFYQGRFGGCSEIFVPGGTHFMGVQTLRDSPSFLAQLTLHTNNSANDWI